MSEYINKIIIPTLDGECELSLDHKANVDDVYKKNETYNKSEVYNKEEVYNKTETYNKEETYNKKETYSKTETKDIVNNSSDKSAELLINVLLAYKEGQSLNVLSDWPTDGATGLDIINDNKGLKGIAQYNSDATNNTKILYTRDNLIYSESTSSFTIRINGTDTNTVTIPSPRAYTSIGENVTSMIQMFNNCKGLTILDLSNFDTSNVTNMSNMFNACSSLTTVKGPITGIKLDLDLSYSPLTAESAMVFINGLSTVTSTKTLKLKSTTYDLLTPEQIAIATSKGWNVIRSYYI